MFDVDYIKLNIETSVSVVKRKKGISSQKKEIIVKHNNYMLYCVCEMISQLKNKTLTRVMILHAQNYNEKANAVMYNSGPSLPLIGKKNTEKKQIYPSPQHIISILAQTSNSTRQMQKN